MQCVQNGGLAAIEKRPLQRPATVASGNRAFEIGESQISFLYYFTDFLKRWIGSTASVVLDEGLPGYCDGEAVAHDSPLLACA